MNARFVQNVLDYSYAHSHSALSTKKELRKEAQEPGDTLGIMEGCKRIRIGSTVSPPSVITLDGCGQDERFLNGTRASGSRVTTQLRRGPAIRAVSEQQSDRASSYRWLC